MLGQLHNDQEDLDGGKGEDLTIHTATYLLVRLLDSAAPHTRPELVELLDAAARTPQAVDALREKLLEPSNAAPVVAWMYELGDAACQLLTDAAPSSSFTTELAARVTAAATPTPVFHAIHARGRKQLQTT